MPAFGVTPLLVENMILYLTADPVGQDMHIYKALLGTCW